MTPEQKIIYCDRRSQNLRGQLVELPAPTVLVEGTGIGGRRLRDLMRRRVVSATKRTSFASESWAKAKKQVRARVLRHEAVAKVRAEARRAERAEAE